MKRALITGITGQDGSYLAELLLSKGENYFARWTSRDDSLVRKQRKTCHARVKIPYGREEHFLR